MAFEFSKSITSAVMSLKLFNTTGFHDRLLFRLSAFWEAYDKEGMWAIHLPPSSFGCSHSRVMLLKVLCTTLKACGAEGADGDDVVMERSEWLFSPAPNYWTHMYQWLDCQQASTVSMG